MTLSFEDGLKALGKLIEHSAQSGKLDQLLLGDDAPADSNDSAFIPSLSSSGLSSYNPLEYDISGFTALAARAKKEVVPEEDDSEESEGVLSKQYMTVALSDDKRKEFSRFFFNRKNSSKIPLFFIHVAQVTARINAFFGLLRFGLEDARRFAMMPVQQRAVVFNEKAQQLLDQMLGSDPQLAVDRFLKACSTGNNHVIVPSRRYPGGYDFDFIGPIVSVYGNASELESIGAICIEMSNSVDDWASGGKSTNEYYQREYLEKYATELSQGLIKTGKQVMEMIAGPESTDVKLATTRQVKQLPLSYDFSALNDIFFNNTGIVLSVNFMENIPSAVVKEYSKFFSLLCVRVPKKYMVRAVNEKKSELLSRARIQNARANTNETPPPLNLEEYLSERILPEGFAVNQIVAFSVSLSFDEETVRYIAQSEKNEPVPMLSLHNWMSIWSRNILRKSGARVEGGKTKTNNLPRVIVPLSKAQRITDLRIKNGMAVEAGKGDANNIFIGANGSLQYGLPAKASDIADRNIAAYESDMEAYLKYCYENGMPVQVSSVSPSELLATTGEHVDDSTFRELNSNVSQYSGKLIAFNWDYNTVITSNVENPSSLVARDLIGSAPLDDLVVADYLGLNFAPEGEPPIQKSFADTLILMQNYPLSKQTKDSPAQTPYDVIGTARSPAVFLGEQGRESECFLGQLLMYYNYLMLSGKVPGARELFAEAAQELGISLDEPLDARQSAVCGPIMDMTTKEPMAFYQAPSRTARFLADCLRYTLDYTAGGFAMRQQISNENPGIDAGTLREMLMSHEDFFTVTSPMADFGKLYSLIPGMVWKLAMKHIIDLDPKVIFEIGKDAIDESKGKLSQPSYANLTTKILPLAVMFAKFVPDALEYFARAEAIREQNSYDPSINESDIRISGANDNAQMFPHQVDTHRWLRKHPKLALLSIGAGGGKTSLGVTDIACMLTELDELGSKRIRPLILCPDNLIKNWVDDMKIFTDNRWNMIPINNKIVDRWGYDELDAVIKNAPPNSIVVAGFNFIKAKREIISIGSHQSRVSNNLEFIKRYGFDYICIDESHKLKNKKSVVHRMVKQLTTASNVRYLRLCSGTMINNVVSDIVGQMSLYNGHILRDGEVSDSRRESQVGSDYVPHWQVDSPARARQKLAHYAAVIHKSKKEWAFMLPSPIEHFYAVKLVPTVEGGATERDIELGELHQQLYDTVLAETEEEIQALLDAVKRVRNSEEDDDDSDDSEGGESDLDMDEEDELANLSQTDLEPYLQRLEMLVTNPMKDPAFEDVFGPAGVKTYHSRKATFVSTLIDKHFNPPKWEKGVNYDEYSFVEYNNKLYLARKLDKTSSMPTKLPASTVGVAPPSDPDTWKEEPEGKVIVFCRYLSSVSGIYEALPEHYKRIAVKYSGDEGDAKHVNLDAFMNDPRIKILVANEMGITEGHNMQLASRIIRVESPWAPGDLEQAASRIFRPDPKAAKDMVKNGKPGELYREAIFLDWVMADNTMEIPKQARLISKIIDNANYDEAENSRYSQVLDDYSGLARIRMNLDLLRSRASLNDYEDYTDGYAAFKAIQREEFHEMRVTGDATMKNLEAQPEVKGSKRIRTPFVAGQKYTEDGLELVSLRNLLRNPEYAYLLKDIDKLKKMPVITDHGPGRIESFITRTKTKALLDAQGNPVRGDTKKGPGTGKIKRVQALDEFGKPSLDENNPISSVRVISAETQQPMERIPDIGTVFVVLNANELSDKELRRFRVNDFNVSKRDQRKAAAEEEAERKRREAEEKAEEDRLIAEARKQREAKKRAEEARAAQRDARQRKKNIREGKPINDGIRAVTTPPPSGLISSQPAAKPSEYRHISLHPTLTQGFLTLEVRADDPDAKLLKKFDFKYTGPYAYVDVTLFRRFEKVFDYLDDNFSIPDAYFTMLDDVQDAFDSDKNGGIYRMEMAPAEGIPYFFAARKAAPRDRNQVRPFPIIFPDFLRIAVDLKTNPAIHAHIGKPVKGASVKWLESPGHYLYFAPNKTALRDKLNELKKAGFVVTNETELNEEIKNIKFRAPRRRS